MAKLIMSPGSVLKYPWLTQVLSPTVLLQVWAIMGVPCLLHTRPCIPFTSDTSPCLPASRSSRSLPWQSPRGSHPSSGIPSTNSHPLKSEGPRTWKDISTEGDSLQRRTLETQSSLLELSKSPVSEAEPWVPLSQECSFDLDKKEVCRGCSEVHVAKCQHCWWRAVSLLTNTTCC